MRQRQELPDAPGKDMVVKLCSGCHEPTVVLTADLSVNGWPGEIQKMIGLGAPGTDAQFREVLNYVAANVSTPVSLVNVNSASEAELELALQISRKDAIAIVEYRAKNGKFKSVDDLKRVPGVNRRKLKQTRAAFPLSERESGARVSVQR